MITDKITFKALKNAPSPKEVDYWIDTTSNPNGGEMKYYDGSKWSKVNGEEQKQPLTDPTHTIRATFRISEDEVGLKLQLIKSQIGSDPNSVSKLYINGIETKNNNQGHFVFDTAGDYLFEIELADYIASLSGAFAYCDQLIKLDCSNLKYASFSWVNMCYNAINLEWVSFAGAHFLNYEGSTGQIILALMFNGCTSLSHVDFSNVVFEINLPANNPALVMSQMFQGCTSLLKFDFNEVFKNVQFPFTVAFNEFLRESGITSFHMNNIRINASNFKNMFLNCTNLKHLIITNCVISGLGESSAAWTYGSLNIETINFNNTEFVTCILSSFLKRGNDESIPCNLSLTGTKFINCDLTNAFSDINTKTVNLTTTIFQNCFGNDIFTGNPYIQSLLISRTFDGVDYFSNSCANMSNLKTVTIKDLNARDILFLNVFAACSNIDDFTMQNVKNADITTLLLFSAVNNLALNHCSFVSISSAFVGLDTEVIDLSTCDLSKCTDMRMAFQQLKCHTIKMAGPIPSDVAVTNMFSVATANTGTFYYDGNYDYSKIIEQLPEGWTAVAQ